MHFLGKKNGKNRAAQIIGADLTLSMKIKEAFYPIFRILGKNGESFIVNLVVRKFFKGLNKKKDLLDF
ncbi:unnamed protein product [marine sediment metagenome]|uniref:Uncharacterized protein n=1 Tax=marine sediment metagenome TaxID=412755 RepID=X1PZW5_9ZZZZ